MAASVAMALGVIAPTASSSHRSSRASIAKDCNTPPELLSFGTIDDPNLLIPEPWIEQFGLAYNSHGGSAFVGVYDNTGGVAIHVNGWDSPGGVISNRGNPLWAAGQRAEHAFIKTACGLKTLTLKFNFSLRPVSVPSGTQTFVAMGDSYSSGEGNPPFIDKSSCHVSPMAWPSLLFSNMGSSAPNFETNLACSGAHTDAILGSFRGLPSQLSRLERLGPTIATITIGGNDIGFSKIIENCFVRDCVADGRLDEATRAILKLKDRLVYVYQQITKKVSTRLVAVGYPRIFPTRQANAVHCGWLEPRERKALNALAAMLDDEERQAASESGVQYVSVLGALNGHELCTKDSWVNPIGHLPISSDGHPTADGQLAIAKIVQPYLLK